MRAMHMSIHLHFYRHRNPSLLHLIALYLLVSNSRMKHTKAQMLQVTNRATLSRPTTYIRSFAVRKNSDLIGLTVRIFFIIV